MTSLEKSHKAIMDTIGRAGLGILISQDNEDGIRIIVFCNDRLHTMLGYTRKELIEKPIWDIVPEANRQGIMERYTGSQRDSTPPSQYETTLLKKDGSKISVEASVSGTDFNDKIATLVLINDITERKQAEEELKESQKDLSHAQSVTQTGSWRLDLRCDEFVCSDETNRIFGIPKETPITYKSFLSQVHPEDREYVASKWNAALHRQGYNIEYRILVDNEPRWINAKAELEFTQEDKCIGCFGTVQDITERKQNEIALLEREEQFFTAFHKNPSAMAISTLSEGRIVDANESFLEMTEYSREELIGRTSDEIDLFGESGGRARTVLQPMKGSDFTKTENVVVINTKTGKHHKIIGSTKVVAINGQPHLISMARDITEQEETEEKYRQLVENMSDGYGVLVNGKFAFTNRRLCEIFGCEPKQMREMSIYDFSVPETRQASKEMFERIMSGDQEAPEWREGRAMKKDGTEITLEIGSRVLPYEGRLGLYIIVRDVTERKLIEEERQKVDKLESLGTLAGGIAHDFNNLLTGIMGNISLIKGTVDPRGEVAMRLEEAEKATVRAKGLTQQLLTFSKGGAPVKKQVSLPDLIEESANFILHGSNVKPVFSNQEDLWAIEADEGQISQVIYNIVKNANEAMPEGGLIEIGSRNITIKKSGVLPLNPGRYVEISIKDTGTGIRKKDIDRIFDPYFSTKQRGSGLGLATGYSIVKNHGGHITLDSKLGAGTTFHIYLPALKKQAQKKDEQAREELQPAFIGQGRILVMDDEDIIRTVIKRILQKIGYEVEVTTDGSEAIEQYIKARESGTPFDAIIMDLTIPGGMGGKEAITKLREIDPKVKAIVSSGYANDPIMAEYKKYGFSAVVAKPYSAIDITNTLDRLLRSTTKR